MEFKDNLMVIGGGFIGRSIIRRHPSSKIITRDLEYKNAIVWPENSETWISTLKKINPEYIIICFGASSVPDVIEKPFKNYEDQIIKLMLVLDSLRVLKSKIKVKKIVVIGSAAEYGNLTTQAISEVSEPGQLNVYGCLKLSVCQICNFYFRYYNLPICYVRQFNTSGPFQSTDFVIPSLVYQYLRFISGKIEILEVGDLEVFRDFIHIEDSIDAYETLIQEGVPGEVYNVCSGEAYQVVEILNYLSRKFGISAKYLKIDKLSREENISKNYIVGDNAKLKALGWKPKRTFVEIIESILIYFTNKQKNEEISCL